MERVRIDDLTEEALFAYDPKPTCNLNHGWIFFCPIHQGETRTLYYYYSYCLKNWLSCKECGAEGVLIVNDGFGRSLFGKRAAEVMWEARVEREKDRICDFDSDVE